MTVPAPKSPRPRAAVILAAGQGTRMKSPTPKVLHKLAGRTLLDHAIDAAQGLGCERIVVVVGAHSPQVGESVRKRLGPHATVVQDPPLGTGHAVLAAKEALADFEGDVVVTYADCPLTTAPVIAPLFDLISNGAHVAVLGFEAQNPTGYGRLILAPGHVLLRIVEEKEADLATKQVKHCNSGVLAADRAVLFDLLANVRNDNAKGEYYLTDVVGLAHERHLSTRAAFAPEASVQGVNAQTELAAALARELGIPLAALDDVTTVDLTVDGADEIGPGLSLIKGGGAALLREKLVWEASSRCVVIADAAKRVPALGKFPLPIEVVRFGHVHTGHRLADIAAEFDLPPPRLRTAERGMVVTDGGNLIYDMASGKIDDPTALAAALKSVTGVVDHGLFLDLADEALVGTDEGVVRLQP